MLNDLLGSQPGMGRSQYIRVLIIGCLDIVISLPVGIISVVALVIRRDLYQSFYPGWSAAHEWSNVVIKVSSGEWKSDKISLAVIAVSQWSSFPLAFVIFVLFGCTKRTVEGYQKIYHIIVTWCCSTTS